MRAKKSLGQNFLRDPNVIERIVGALDLTKDDVVIEIGPGQGALTETLLEKAGRVVAIEFDRDLISPLRVQFHSTDNFELVNADALSIDLSLFFTEGKKLKLVANLPYNISTPILQRLIDQRHLFETIVLMFQREVVERITATPGKKERGFLSVLVEDAFETEHLFDVEPQAFVPIPKVWSGVVRLEPKSSAVSDPTSFRRLLSSSFAQKRKTIYNNLKCVFDNASAILLASDIDPTRRAETLTLDEWRKLAGTVSDMQTTPANSQKT